MHILLAPAKTMKDLAPGRKVSGTTVPVFEDRAVAIARDLAGYTVEELQLILGVNREIAVENYLRYKDFGDQARQRPAALLYDGIVFKKAGLDEMDDRQLTEANHDLSICSFLYGLLRPLDVISPYRLEGKVELTCTGGKTMFDYWRPLLTDVLIERVGMSGGTLVNLASNEMRQLFDWRRVTRTINVVSPTFGVMRDGKPRSVTVYAKMCRGAMTRFILQNKIDRPEGLADFDYEGFRLRDAAGWSFVLD
ncbi:MAG: YaaA family protein [Bacteroidales bacterium]|nr:YaaA family protein [Bacteroidales bacterium]